MAAAPVWVPRGHTTTSLRIPQRQHSLLLQSNVSSNSFGYKCGAFYCLNVHVIWCYYSDKKFNVDMNGVVFRRQNPSQQQCLVAAAVVAGSTLHPPRRGVVQGALHHLHHRRCTCLQMLSAPPWLSTAAAPPPTLVPQGQSSSISFRKPLLVLSV